MSGRPRRACGTCQSQKIRCTGEKPVCKRCVRLQHSCSYGATLKARRVAERAQHVSMSQPAPTNNSPSLHLSSHYQGSYVGIPKPLITELTDIYFDNVSNSSLLLHKARFLSGCRDGTIAPHTLFSVCAFGSNFYKDDDGVASLKKGGFMIEWAQQAGRLAFQEIENFSKDLVVTFLNLALFWHSQGSWKVSSLYKANAFHFLCVHGIGDTQRTQSQTFEVEVQRRRFWAWYVMHCHNNEGFGVLEPVGDLSNLPLPWTEDEFATGTLSSATTTLVSTEGSTSILAELTKIITLWSQAVNLIRTPEPNLTAGTVASIYALDEKVSLWWRKLPTSLKLDADSFVNAPPLQLPLPFLMNLVYHQTLCILHASIVPLFCWTESDDGWLSTRKMSAQIAYENACTVSTLIEAALSSKAKLSAMPTFVAYAAYGGCAILIPFTWCSNLSIRHQAQASVRTNIRMIHGMAEYWKFAALLTLHVNCLYNIHKRNPPILNDEPQYDDIQRLTSFKIESLYARVSILEFLGILRTGPSSFAEPGHETVDLGIKGGAEAASVPDAFHVADEIHGPIEVSQMAAITANSSAQSTYKRDALPHLMQSQQWNLLPPSGPVADNFSPSFALDDLEPLVGNSTMDWIESDLNYGLLDIDGWDYTH